MAEEAVPWNLFAHFRPERHLKIKINNEEKTVPVKSL